MAAFFPCGGLLAELKLLSMRVLMRAQKCCVLSGNGAGSGLIQLAVVELYDSYRKVRSPNEEPSNRLIRIISTRALQ